MSKQITKSPKGKGEKPKPKKPVNKVYNKDHKLRARKP